MAFEQILTTLDKTRILCSVLATKELFMGPVKTARIVLAIEINHT
jgi:hypothetical protein